MTTKGKEINCLKCHYFYVTWDKDFPRGCKFFDFKTKNMPSIEVLRSSGMECLKFISRNLKNKNKAE